ncbi:hypothetical protein KIW84_072432 [Lathyrus oleraceus]|uniref:Retrovirus-related Pol polyprotein from transposon TNT 1-94-like beta-barrel domain-containing protein n=1 Tax=Pisum sativum TaxID=3888 RepID=A0A9D4ZXF2_PEA|nr:hypothetical protein KIW84_072432 [Pisum sativum]
MRTTMEAMDAYKFLSSSGSSDWTSKQPAHAITGEEPSNTVVPNSSIPQLSSTKKLGGISLEVPDVMFSKVPTITSLQSTAIGLGKVFMSSDLLKENEQLKKKFKAFTCERSSLHKKDCHSFKCYNYDKVGHLAKDCRIEKKVEETTNLTLEAGANEGFLLMAQNEINTNDNVWYLDSGASNHMCGHKHLFKEMRKIEDGNVSFGDASKVKVEGKGTIRYLQKNGLIGSIQDVYYVPNLKTNVLSLGQLTEKGYSILMKERILHLKDKLGHLIARVEMEINRMYKLNLINVREKCLQVNVEDKASLWHLRFGHLHHAGLKRA